MQHEPENFRQKRLAMTLKDAVINTYYSIFHTPQKDRFGSGGQQLFIHHIDCCEKCVDSKSYFEHIWQSRLLNVLKC